MLVHIPAFTGIIKALDASKLKDTEGQAGVDCRLDNGTLRPWKQPAKLYYTDENPLSPTYGDQIEMSGLPTGSVFWHPNRYVGWPAYQKDVNAGPSDGTTSYVYAVNAPVVDDPFKRMYYTGDWADGTGAGWPKVTFGQIPETNPVVGTGYTVGVSAVAADSGQPPAAYARMGHPGWRASDQPRIEGLDQAGTGQIVKMSISFNTPKATTVFTAEPVYREDLVTGNKVVLDFPGVSPDEYRVKVLSRVSNSQWRAKSKYYAGAVVYVVVSGTRAYYRALADSLGEYPPSYPLVWELLTDTDILPHSFTLTNYKIPARNWTRLRVLNGSTEFEVTCPGVKVDIGDAIAFRTILSGTAIGASGTWLERGRLYEVVATEANGVFWCAGVGDSPAPSAATADYTITTSQTARYQYSKFWVVSKAGENFEFPGAVASNAVVDWTDGSAPFIEPIGIPFQETWTRADLVSLMTTRAYVATYINVFGEESGPSNPSATLDVTPGTEITFDIFDDPITGESTYPLPLHPRYYEYQVRLWRLYRTDVSGTYRFVADILVPGAQTGYERTFSGSTTYQAGDLVVDATTDRHFRSLRNDNSAALFETPLADPPVVNSEWWYEVYALPFVDDLDDTELGEPIPTMDYLPPPQRLSGLIGLPGGILCAFNGADGGSKKEVCFSEPYHPYAWPLANRVAVEHDVVGLVATQAGVVVATRGKPAIIVGDNPAFMQVVKLEQAYSCMSAKSIVDMGDYAIYAAPQGLVAIAGNTAKVITEGVLTREQWNNYDPKNLVGGTYDGKYVGFCPDLLANTAAWSDVVTYSAGDIVWALYTIPGLEGFEHEAAYISLRGNNLNHPPPLNPDWWGPAPMGFIFDPNTGAFSDLSSAYSVAVNHLQSDDLFVVASTGAPYNWQPSYGADYRPFTFASKAFDLPRPANFAAMQVVCDNYGAAPTRISLYGDYQLLHTQLVAGAYAAGKTYAVGDRVLSSGIYYQSLQAANIGHTPASSPTWWAVLPSPTDPFRLPAGDYSSNVWIAIQTTDGTGEIVVRRVVLAESMSELQQA